MLRVFALVIMTTGMASAHEVPGWRIENVRGEMLKTTISTDAFTGDWCGEKPATLAFVCDDAELSLIVASNCMATVMNVELV